MDWFRFGVADSHSQSAGELAGTGGGVDVQLRRPATADPSHGVEWRRRVGLSLTTVVLLVGSAQPGWAATPTPTMTPPADPIEVHPSWSNVPGQSKILTLLDVTSQLGLLDQPHLDPGQHRLIAAALARLDRRVAEPTLVDLRTVLAHPDRTLAADLDTTADELADRRRPLLDGCVALLEHDLRGIGDGPTIAGSPGIPPRDSGWTCPRCSPTAAPSSSSPTPPRAGFKGSCTNDRP